MCDMYLLMVQVLGEYGCMGVLLQVGRAEQVQIVL